MSYQNLITNHKAQGTNHAITLWLTLCLLLIAAMVLIGGYTRLSGSGLSITSWKPIHGIIPPLNETEWNEEFAAYQTSPQYQKINNGMALDDFKTIFWPEFIHRLLGRIIGAVFFIPLIIFAARKSITKRFGIRLACIFALGGLQGLIGWLMVKSGLVDDPHVSVFRLALHLSLAFAIYGAILWCLLDVLANKIQGTKHKSPGTFFTLLILQIILGAFMAGTHAGLVYNSWPSMNGQFLPDGLLDAPWYGNPAFIQFLHRNVAYLTIISFHTWWFCNRQYVKNIRLTHQCLLLSAVLIAQASIGILTLLKLVPLPLALAHQMMALLLFTLAVKLMYKVRQEQA